MNKITVLYWIGYNYSDINIDHEQSYDYSEKTKNELINLFLGHGHHVMLQQRDETLLISIDDRQFKQR
jgi:hypothetical protein